MHAWATASCAMRRTRATPSRPLWSWRSKFCRNVLMRHGVMTPDAFYDQLAPFYHLIYPDWEASMMQQAAAVDSIMQEFWGAETTTILDVACGIGTQALGLAQLGYQVTAADLSHA